MSEMEDMAEKIIDYCRRNKIKLGDKMEVAIRYVGKNNGRANIEKILDLCKTKFPDITERGLRNWFGQYSRKGLLKYNARTRLIEFYTEFKPYVSDFKNNQFEPMKTPDIKKISSKDIPIMKAKKHIEICLSIKNIAKIYLPNLKSEVYIGTYTARKIYQKIEEKTAEDFWSVRLYTEETLSRISNIKNPDVIIVSGNNALYVIEVKWGWDPRFNLKVKSDLLDIFTPSELDKTQKAISEGKICRITGPAVEAGVRKSSVIFENGKKFKINNSTKFLLVSDFYQLKRDYPDYNDIINKLNAIRGLIYLDHNITFNNIQSFKDYIITNMDKE